VTLKHRLDKLEAPTVKRWREAWQVYTVYLYKHLDPILDPLKAAATEAEGQGLFSDEAALNASCEAFCERIGVPSPFALSVWEARAELPDPDAPPDLSRWPSNLPEPPPEPSDVREKLEPYRDSPDTHERFTALLYLFFLSHARARREYLAS
jgi:hypothetical protein